VLDSIVRGSSQGCDCTATNPKTILAALNSDLFSEPKVERKARGDSRWSKE
jgi:hypothetical protein